MNTYDAMRERAEAAEAHNARLQAALNDCGHILWNVLHNGMLVPSARRLQLEVMEGTIKAALETNATP